MILNKIKFFEAHWSNRKKYEKIAGFVDGTQGLLGCRVISDGRINWWTYSPLVVVSTYWLLAIFTVCYHTSHNQLGKALPSLCLFGISISSSSGLLAAISKTSYRVKNMATKINAQIYGIVQTQEYADICARNLDRTWKSYLIIIIAIISSITCAFLLGPVYAFVVHNRLTSFVQLKIPFVDEDSRWEFVVNCVLQTISGVFVTLGNIGIEGILVMFVNTLNVTTDISKYEYDEFSIKLASGVISESETKLRMSRMCQQTQAVDRLMYDASSIYYWRNLLSPTTFTFSIGLSIYCQYALDFPAGYGLAIMSYGQLLTMCVFGESYIRRNNAVGDGIYELLWYLLPNRHQKEIRLLIQHLQYGPIATIGPLGCMNLETAKVLTKQVYSLLMYLMNFSG